MRIWPGHPYPLGATWDGAGVNFAIYAENATKVELCLFDSADSEKESHRITAQGIHRQGLACLPARRACRPALRLSVPRAVRSVEGASLQSQQGRARSLCQADRPRRRAGPTSFLAIALTIRKPTSRSTTATVPRTLRWRRSSIRRSPGATIGRRARPGTRRSSTSCTSRDSRS